MRAAGENVLKSGKILAERPVWQSCAAGIEEKETE
jgi:hypothetical protein